MSAVALFLAVFLACSVEAVEATTIVLAAGTARSWRSALTGVAVGLAALVVIVGVAGPSIQLLPLGLLRLVIGGLLLIFGLQWIRKAVLRASGYKALHDEDAIFQANLEQARQAERSSRFGVSDWYAFTLSFKGVLLEGLEVAFIVVTFGTNQHQLGLAAIAAAAAVVVIVLLGVAVRAPLARIPENALKFVVGIMLTSFGIFWGAEGAGASWPGADISLLVIAPVIAVTALALAWLLRTRRNRRVPAPQPGAEATTALSTQAPPAAGRAYTARDGAVAEADPPATAAAASGAAAQLKAFGLFWYDFVVGDDWHVAGGVVIAFLCTYLLAAGHQPSWWLLPTVVIVLLPYSLWRAVRVR